MSKTNLKPLQGWVKTSKHNPARPQTGLRTILKLNPGIHPWADRTSEDGFGYFVFDDVGVHSWKIKTPDTLIQSPHRR
jgi:hypothetical protein